MTRKILIVSYEFPPIQGAGIWRMLGMATHLPTLGWDVSVFCSDRSSWHDRTEPGLLSQVPSQVRIHRIKGRIAGSISGRYLPEPLVRSWRNLLPNRLSIPVVKLAAKILRRAPREPFVVLTSGPPHITHLVGLLLKRTRRCVWVADYRDLWMDDPVQAWPGWYQPALGRSAERAVLHSADAIVTVSQTWAALLEKKASRPVQVIRNAADIVEPLPLPERPWPDSERVLLFAGTPQRNNTGEDLWRGIRRYFDTLGAGKAPIRFVFLGLDPQVRDILSRLGLSDRIEDCGWQPLHRAVALLRGADAALVPLTSGGTPVTRGTIPAKLYQAVALGKPIVLLADAGCEAAELLAGYPFIFARSDDPEAIAAALHRFAVEPVVREAPPPPVLANWSRHAAAVALDQLVGQVQPGFARASHATQPAAASQLPFVRHSEKARSGADG